MGAAAAAAGGCKNEKMHATRANCDMSLDVRPLCARAVLDNTRAAWGRWFSAAVAAGIRGLFNNYVGIRDLFDNHEGAVALQAERLAQLFFFVVDGDA